MYWMHNTPPPANVGTFIANKTLRLFWESTVNPIVQPQVGQGGDGVEMGW